MAREVEFDPGTCTHTLAEATYTPDTLPAAYQDEFVNDSATANREGDQVGPLTTVYIGQIKVNVEDPAQIDVSSTTAKVTWSGGSCVNSSNHYAYWGWYSPSGWQRTNASWGLRPLLLPCLHERAWEVQERAVLLAVDDLHGPLQDLVRGPPLRRLVLGLHRLQVGRLYQPVALRADHHDAVTCTL